MRYYIALDFKLTFESGTVADQKVPDLNMINYIILIVSFAFCHGFLLFDSKC
jgi:hypothetical protein